MSDPAAFLATTESAAKRPPPSLSRRSRSLDGVRGIAILMVVAGHAIGQLASLPIGLRDWLVAFVNPGQGVRLFFALSGYLITYLLLEETARSGAIDLRAFWVRRARRILPAFALFMAVVAAWGLAAPGSLSWPHWLAAASFTWNYALPALSPHGESTWLLGHTWSLAVEAQFYLAWPFVLARLGPRRALMCALVLLAAQPLIRTASYLLFPDLRGYLGMMLHTHADSILAGCAAAILVHRGIVPTALRRTPAWIAPLWLLVLSPLANHLLRGFWLYAGSSLDALAAAVLLIRLHEGPGEGRRDALARGPLPWLGLVSYSLYLWQQLLLDPRVSGGALIWPVVSALLFASLSWRFVERPFLSRPPSSPSRLSVDERRAH